MPTGANYIYRRWELNDIERLEHALPSTPTRAPTPVAPRVLRRFGADLARTNKAVAAYEHSALYGRLYEGATHYSVRVSRRTLDVGAREERDALRDAARAIGAPVELRYTAAATDELWKRIVERDADGRWGARSIERHELDDWSQFYQRPTEDEIVTYDGFATNDDNGNKD